MEPSFSINFSPKPQFLLLSLTNLNLQGDCWEDMMTTWGKAISEVVRPFPLIFLFTSISLNLRFKPGEWSRQDYDLLFVPKLPSDIARCSVICHKDGFRLPKPFQMMRSREDEARKCWRPTPAKSNFSRAPVQTIFPEWLVYHMGNGNPEDTVYGLVVSNLQWPHYSASLGQWGRDYHLIQWCIDYSNARSKDPALLL